MIYTGITGAIKVGEEASAKAMKHMSGFDLEISAELIEALSLGDEWRNRVPGIKDWNATLDGSASFDSDTEQKTILDAIYDGAIVTLGFYLNPTTYFEGPAYIETCSVSVTADGKADISFSAQGAGALTKTVPATVPAGA